MSGGIAKTAPPWARATLTCIGWIPTADGHLSFSLIGQGTKPTCYRYSGLVNDEDGRPRRNLAVFQRRKSMDIPWLFRWFMPSAKHHWLLTGEALPAKYHTDSGETHPILDQQGMLCGQILFIPYQHDDKPGEEGDGHAAPRCDMDAKWQAARERIVELLRADRGPDIGKVFSDLDAETDAIAKAGITTLTIEYALFRTGEIHLWMTDHEIAKIRIEKKSAAPGAYPLHAQIGHDDLDADAHYIGLSEIPAPHTMLRQAYYFVKDAAHYHVHHDGSSDQIIPLVLDHPEDTDPSSQGEASISEQAWQRETLWGLSRSIEELVRQGTREALRNALGFICFAESFQSTLAQHVRKNGYLNQFAEVVDIHRYDFKSLRESVKIALERNTWSLAGKAAMAGTVATIGLSSVIATNAIGNHPVPGEPSIWDGWLADFIKSYPLAPPAICVALVVLAFFRIYSDTGFLKRLFAIENAWSRFVRSHVRFLMSRYKRAGKPWLSFLLTAAIFLIPIAGLSYLMSLLYGYLPG